MQTTAVRIHRHGGPEVLCIERIDVAKPAANEILVRQTAVGLNYSDIYQRAGEAAGPHAVDNLPITLGSLGAGMITAVGSDVDAFRPGEFVAYLQVGAYAVDIVVPAARAVPLPKEISAEFAAAWLLRGMTAEYLLRRLYEVKPGDTILVHAAAGGMGEVLCQWARALGVHVLGTVGSAHKVEIALRKGCDAVVDLSSASLVDEVVRLTGRRGVDVVYDAVGKDVFLESLECLRPRGWCVSYGTASGPVGPFDLQRLHAKSLVVTRPTLRTFIASPSDLQTSARAFFNAVLSGQIRLDIEGRYPLLDAARAHSDLEGRRTTGASILLP